ncbi:DeoR family transcriptional regulator [Longimycelium tulufanense]|uniref:Lactose phosphotransferase system repressor n=1 Tax=Longimycelium tulufanense TaxID=907463 RepID=A0A8J3FTY7_9PSEU|nr:DeoR/GlpR family DNA-binding transcription regulator [Longimycelium tulufanense]GGM38674.1 DeoR family transcriptional regulator [Longimycelium tulufanense]
MTRKARPSEAAVEQRRQDILGLVLDRGELRIAELAERFDVSLMTMHRDLDDLAARHLLRKLRGRVASFPPLTVETATRFREGLRLAEKSALAAAAIGEVVPGSTVLVDDSTTNFPLAGQLTRIERLTVITNSVRVAQTVASAPEASVVFIGGRYHGEFESTSGPDTLRALASIRPDLAFVSATAITHGHLYHPVQDYALIKQEICRSAARSVLLVDHSKFGRTATYPHGDVGSFDLVVTDDRIPAEELQAIRDFGVEVRVAPVRREETNP